MRALLLDAFNKDIRVINPDGLQDYYSLLNCSSVDVISKNISDKRFNLIFDNEAELLETHRPSAIDDCGQVVLFNNLIITGEDNLEGNLSDLTDKEIEYIKKYIHIVRTSKYPCGCLLLCHVG
ncbi:uncharacterized protein BN751_01578 [Coprococcus eutactus CAG:665]|nr:uncharacterized protein BN751_01578 [Coprococcus eutactus CAG:665]